MRFYLCPVEEVDEHVSVDVADTDTRQSPSSYILFDYGPQLFQGFEFVDKRLGFVVREHQRFDCICVQQLEH